MYKNAEGYRVPRRTRKMEKRTWDGKRQRWK
nr:MAG TPA: hypothetical protein [Caudoviricetes sp.]